jgi:hypothetical protein
MIYNPLPRDTATPAARRSGEVALDHALTRARECLRRGDMPGVLAWVRIAASISEMPHEEAAWPTLQ